MNCFTAAYQLVGTTGLFGSSLGSKPSPEGAAGAGAVPPAGAVAVPVSMIDVVPDL